MYRILQEYCKSKIEFSTEELKLVEKYFIPIELIKKEFLLKEENVCDFVGFIVNGCIRHFHIKNGVEKTCDISFENMWITDFQSLIYETPSIMNLQAMQSSTLLIIKRGDLNALYNDCSKYETFGRLMAENVAQRATEIAMSLSSEKPEERFINLMKKHPHIFQRVPQKYIANYLGVSAESLSRIRNRIYKKSKS